MRRPALSPMRCYLRNPRWFAKRHDIHETKSNQSRFRFTPLSQTSKMKPVEGLLHSTEVLVRGSNDVSRRLNDLRLEGGVQFSSAPDDRHATPGRRTGGDDTICLRRQRLVRSDVYLRLRGPGSRAGGATDLDGGVPCLDSRWRSEEAGTSCHYRTGRFSPLFLSSFDSNWPHVPSFLRCVGRLCCQGWDRVQPGNSAPSLARGGKALEYVRHPQQADRA